jgi:carotenoid cleavage dioxygenase-like enzyme
MASPIDRQLPPRRGTAVAAETTRPGHRVRGALPDALSGRLLGIHGNAVHLVQLDHGGELSYRTHRVQPHTRTTDVMVFGDSILAFGRGSLAHQFSPDLDVLNPVDLAGQSRRLASCPKRDEATGDLHLLAAAPDGSQAHVVVSSGALTRRSRSIIDPPNPVDELAIAGDHIVFASRGFIGVGARDLESRTRWITTGVDAPAFVHAHFSGATVVVHAVTPSLERWTINLASSSVHREVLDPAHQRFARITHVSELGRQLLWTVGDRAADTYDLITGRHVHRSFGQRRPGDLVFVADPARPSGDGWLVGFVHDEPGLGADLVILDAADISRPAVAVAHIPRPVPVDLHTTWIPGTSQQPQQGDTP